MADLSAATAVVLDGMMPTVRKYVTRLSSRAAADNPIEWRYDGMDGGSFAAGAPSDGTPAALFAAYVTEAEVPDPTGPSDEVWSPLETRPVRPA